MATWGWLGELIENPKPRHVPGLATVAVMDALRQVGLRAPHDGWRMACRMHLRGDASRFTLAALGVATARPKGSPLSDTLIPRLTAFLKEEPLLQQATTWTPRAAIPIPHPPRVISADFAPDGRLLSLDGRESTFVHMYNRWRTLPDTERAWRLEKLSTTLFRSIWLVVEARPGDRITPPVLFPHAGGGLFTIHARPNSDGTAVDLWFHTHHVPIDGAPLEEALQRLKQKWGVIDPMEWPAAPYESRVLNINKQVQHQLIGLDFRPFLEYRKRRGISVGGLLLWALGRHPAMQGAKLAMTVDRTLQNGRRTVGMLAITPGRYDDFDTYRTRIEQLIESTRNGSAPMVRLLEATAAMPPALVAFNQSLSPRLGRGLMGSTGLSILKNCDVFLAPYNPVYARGFIALGRLDRPLGLVSIKAAPEHLEGMRTALEEISQDPEKWGGSLAPAR